VAVIVEAVTADEDPDARLEPSLQRRFQQRVRSWLRLCTYAFVALALVGPFNGRLAYLAVALPLVNGLAVWTLFVLPGLIDRRSDGSDRYIRDHHPEIWKHLHPWGLGSHDGFSALALARGWHDDGSDPFLQLIKQRHRQVTHLQFWALGLIPASWVALLMATIFASAFFRLDNVAFP
jgi:hypothetical protein